MQSSKQSKAIEPNNPEKFACHFPQAPSTTMLITATRYDTALSFPPKKLYKDGRGCALAGNDGRLYEMNMVGPEQGEST